MTVPTLIERTPTGFRASTGGPLELTADGPTVADALAALSERLAGGAALAQLPVPGRLPPARTTADVDQETWDGFLQAMAENRLQTAAEEWGADAARDVLRAAGLVSDAAGSSGRVAAG